MSKLKIVLFRIGLFQVIALAAYHLYLPYHMQWQQGLTTTPGMLSWALMFLNKDWSIIVLLWGGLLLFQSFETQIDSRAKSQSCAVFTLFWVLHTGMQLLDPAPIPAQLGWLSFLFIAFGVQQMVLIGLGIGVFGGIRTNGLARVTGDRASQ